jgi:hypothetical protein
MNDIVRSLVTHGLIAITFIRDNSELDLGWWKRKGGKTPQPAEISSVGFVSDTQVPVAKGRTKIRFCVMIVSGVLEMTRYRINLVGVRNGI